MLRLFKKILTTGVVTETSKAPKDDELEKLGITFTEEEVEA